MKRLSIADIAVIILTEDGRSGFFSEDLEFIRSVFKEGVRRKVMKSSEDNWCERVLAGVERSQGFIKSNYRGRRVFTIKQKQEGFIR